MANEATLNDVIERQIAEGKLTRNSGTNSLKSLKDIIGAELSGTMTKISDMSSSMVNLAESSLNRLDFISEILQDMRDGTTKAAREAAEARLESRNIPQERAEAGDKPKKKGMLDGFKMPKMGIMGWAVLLAGAAAAFVGLDGIIKWFKEKLVPGMKKFWDDGLKPFWENVIKPMVEWFTATALPALGDAFMRNLDMLGEFFSGLANVGKLIAEGDYLGAVNELVNTVGKFIVDSVDSVITLALNLFGVDLKGKTAFQALSDWVGDIIGKVEDWWKDNVYDGEKNKIFGFKIPTATEAVDWINDINKAVDDWWKENIYDGEKNKIFGFKIPTATEASDWISDLSKKTTKWFEDNIYDGNTKIFGTELMGGQGDDELDGGGESFITAIGRKIDDWIKENIYDGVKNTIFGHEIPKELFKFNMFNSIKQKVDDVILAIKEIFTGPFTMANLLSKTTLVGKTFLDLIWVPLDLIIGAVRDIFKFGDPKTPFRMTEFIFGDKEGKGGVLPSIIGFFTNEEGTGIFDFSKPGEEFSIMGVVTKLMKKISDFFTSLLDIDFGAIVEKLIPDGPFGDAFRKLTGLKSPEQIKIEKQEIKDQIAFEQKGIDTMTAKQEELGKNTYEGRRGDRIDAKETKIAELEARLAELEPKAAVMTQTSDSAVKTAEARLASAVNDNRLIVAPANMGGGGGGAAPDMRGGNTTVVNNSSKKTETRVSLIDRTRPEQLHARRFAAGGT